VRWLSRSLQVQLVLGLSLIVVVSMATMYGWLFSEFRSAERKMRDWAIEGQARALQGYLVHGEDGELVLRLPPDTAVLYGGSEPRYRYIVSDEQGRVRLAAGWRPDQPPHVAPRNTQRIYEYDADRGRLAGYVGAVLPVDLDGERLWVQAEQYRQDRHILVRALLDDFMEDGGWVPVPFFLALLGVGVVLIRRTLAPLGSLSRAAEAIGPANVAMRLSEEGVPTEVLALVHAINRGLERLETALNLQRDFTADAAHELRTPLAVLTAQIERLPDRRAARPLVRDLQAMARLVEQLLRVAQLDALAIDPSGKVDLAATATDVAAYLAPLAIDAGREIEVEGAERPVLVRGNSGAVHHALRNLVENGLAHTAPGTAVTLRVHPTGAVEVQDRGPGIAPAHRPQIFRRFWRGDRAGTRSGAGLGLAIVDKVMAVHGGRVTVGDRPGGGASFRLEFPA